MIANISRLVNMDDCKQKEFNQGILRLRPKREAEPLMTGESFHAGAACVLAGGSVAESVERAEDTYRKRIAPAWDELLIEERQNIESEIKLAKDATKAYFESYHGADYTIIHPEVEFLVPIVGSEHHCYFAHQLLHPEIYSLTECTDERCIIPHYFKGRSDAIIQWKGMIWILEHKTSADNKGIWWDQWILDFQTTGYLYGVSKAIGLRANGIILNKINKPRKNAVDKRVTIEREPFLRTDEDLQRFEDQFRMRASEYERSIRDNIIWMNTKNCFDYNRRCYFHSTCINHQVLDMDQFITRDPDYVELAYYDLLGLPKPPLTIRSTDLETISEPSSE